MRTPPQASGLRHYREFSGVILALAHVLRDHREMNEEASKRASNRSHFVSAADAHLVGLNR